jgi:hypothetical protein
VEKFLTCTVEELGMVRCELSRVLTVQADIPLLLSDYKRLASLNDSLMRTLRLNVAM